MKKIMFAKVLLLAGLISSCRPNKNTAFILWDSTGKTEVILPRLDISDKKNSEIIVNAGEQAVLTDTGLVIRKVDTKDWKLGDLICDEMPLIDVMRHISRWYAVEILPDYPDVKLNGKLSMEYDLLDLLPRLEQMCGLKFKVENRTIVVA